MQKNRIIVGIGLLLLGIGTGYALWGDSQGSRVGHMMPDGKMMGQDIDQHFITQMIPHHEGAIEMARVALERSKRPEILSLSRGIIEAQEKEIKDMQSWHQSWYNSAPGTSGGAMHMDGMTGDLTTLESTSDANFDREFIEQMIPHHEMAVMMAQMLQGGTKRPEMKQLAENIITSQSQEIMTMRTWLKNWYP